MPIYEYICENCAQEIEVMHSVNAVGPSHCSRCGGTLQRKVSITNANFGKFTSRSAERHSKLPVQKQAESELDRLAEHARRTGIPLNDLFEIHD